MRAEGREYLRRVGPLMVGGVVACTAAAAALTTTVDEPAFETLVHTAIFIGIVTSTVGGVFDRSTTWVGLLIMAAAVAGLAQRGVAVPFFDLMYPPEVVAEPELTWATLVTWGMVSFCFMLARRHNILFAVVSGLAVFGLVGTVNLNTTMLVCFAVFVFALVFIWGYEHLLNVGEQLPHTREGRRDWLQVARIQALAATMLVALLLALAFGVGTVLYALGPRLFVGPAGMARYTRWLQVSLLSYGGVVDTFYVGQGPVNLPATPAIRVKADYPALWRGAVFDYYGGYGWAREITNTTPLEPVGGGWWALPNEAETIGEITRRYGRRNRQLVTILNMDSRTIYAAATPIRVRQTSDSERTTRLRYQPEVDFYGALRTPFSMAGGVEWEIVSIMPPTDAETLRAAPADYPPEIVRRYVDQMQVQTEAELGPIVERITAGLETPYDRAQAIREFLSSTCLYTTRAPAVPRGHDAAAYFVTESRRGACDLFATAMAVMARLAGIPARVATGFQVGDYDPQQDAYVPQQRDAHAWAELYFPGVGWVPFDVSGREAGGTDDIFALLGDWRWRGQVRETVIVVGRVVLLVALAVALVSAVVGPSVVLRWLHRHTRSRSPRQRMGETFEWFHRRAARMAGLRPERWRTPAEVRDALVGAGLAVRPRMRARLDDFVDRFYALRYGTAEPSEDEVRELRAAARGLLADLRHDLRLYRARRKREGK